MEERAAGGSHKIVISNRKNGVLNGVIDVLSFDVGEILLETELGMLMIKGNDLHVNRLTLESTVSPIQMLRPPPNKANLFWEDCLSNAGKR